MTIPEHYSCPHLLENIFAALIAAGKNPMQLTIDDLAPVDEFHTRGKHATRQLAKLANPQPSDRVLDLGCGLGGSARFLADQFGCHVTGIDITTDYINASTRLTELVNLQGQCQFIVGDATQLPFPDESFDMVWTEHASMNIQDKQRLYAEVARILKPQGKFVFHDVFSVDPGQIKFPLPWADSPEISFLISLSQLKKHLSEADFKLSQLKGVDASPLATASANGTSNNADHPLNLGLLMGANYTDKVRNHMQNLERKSTVVQMGVAIKQKSLS